MKLIDSIKQKVNDYLDARYIEHLNGDVAQVFREMAELKGWSNQELRGAGTVFRQDLAKGKPLADLVIPTFAVCAEAARRVLGQVPYDVQVLGGMIIHRGIVAEMKAGEGKTLTETMPVYLNALTGNGVHVVTTNDYLAERDAKAMGKLYDFLGLTTEYVASDMKNEQRRGAYLADVTYVSNQEIGFDYLRDNLVYARGDRVLRKEHPLCFGIVDEIDSILIDESRTPLIVAESSGDERNMYDEFVGIVGTLEENKDYTVEYQNKFIQVTDAGYDKVEKKLGRRVFSKDNPMFAFYLDVSLKARVLFEKDRDYIVMKDGIEIVDEFTGRVLPGRRFTDGVHQAIEAKEHVKVKGADKTTASITFQNFFPMYEKLSGMSGTVMRARDEFFQVYKLTVVQIPTYRPLRRTDHHDLFFKTEAGKFQYLVKKVRQLHKKGQPVLIGTRNVETAHKVAELITAEDMPFQLLTAADNRAEADKVSKGGQHDMVTVATNMAGRGTDILLGPGVEDLGGLFVLGTERHESRRIDDQLIGRAGRQGEMGETQFLVSMEDEIMQLFGSEDIIDTLEQYDIPEDEGIGGPTLDEAFARAQDFVESRNLDSRLYLYKYDRVTNFQRNEVYRLRDSLLENTESYRKFLAQAVVDVLDQALVLGAPGDVARECREVYGVQLPEGQLKAALEPKARPELMARLRGELREELSARCERIRELADVDAAAEHLVLKVIDDAWGKHLELMDVLKEEANLFSYASADPLLDYIRDSRQLFADMGRDIQRTLVQNVFRALEARLKK